MIAVVYARKSTEQLADEEKSVARHVEHGRAYAARKGWVAAGVMSKHVAWLLCAYIVAGCATQPRAWILWAHYTGTRTPIEQWSPLGSHERKRDCDQSLVELMERGRKSDEVTATFSCLPDTIDPRGPKR